MKIQHLRRIAKATGDRYVIVKDGVITDVVTSEVIPHSLIMYQQPPKDDWYKLSEATCGSDSGCEVGAPKPGCSAYSPQKCAVYSFWQFKEFHVSPEHMAILLDMHDLIPATEVT